MRTTHLIAASMAGVLAVAGGAHAQETVSLTFQSAYPSADPQYEHFVRWAERIEEHSGGRLQIEALPAGSIVPPFEVLDATHAGVIDGAHAWSGYWIGKDHAAVMVSSGPAGPFGMNSWDYWGWIWLGGGLEVNHWFFQEHLETNVVWFPSGSTGSQSFGWYNKELKSAEDLAGVTLRIPGIPGEIYEHMGLTVLTLPGGEIVPAGERGVIDAAEYVGPYVDVRMGFHDIWEYHYAPAWHEVVTVAEMLFNKDVWESLPEDIRDTITLVTREHHLWWEQHQQMNRKLAMDELVGHGVEFRRTPDDILEQSLDAWHELFMEEYENNEAFRRIANSQMDWASKTVVAKRILEPNHKDIADIYWAPNGFIETMDLEFDYEAPPYYRAFSEKPLVD